MPKIQQHTTTNSERAVWSECPMKWALQYGLGIRPKKEAEALTFGSLFHDALEAWWDRSSEGGGYRIAAGERAIDEGVDQLVPDAPVGFSTEEPNRGTSASKLEEWRGLLKDMLWGYERRYGAEIDNKELKLILNESAVRCATQTPAGKRSPWSHYQGKLDKVVEDGFGQHWILDHKTSGSALKHWRSRHEYSPQALTYGWLYRESTGITPAGIVYDLCLKAAPAKPSEYPRKKDGFLSKRIPANAEAESFLKAVLATGKGMAAEPWYAVTLSALKAEREKFFRREWVRWSDTDLDRMGAELHAVSSTIRRAHNTTLKIKEAAPAIDEQVMRSAYAFPRNDACYKYGRPCSYLGLCRVAQTRTEIERELFDFRIAGKIHEEY